MEGFAQFPGRLSPNVAKTVLFVTVGQCGPPVVCVEGHVRGIRWNLSDLIVANAALPLRIRCVQIVLFWLP